MYDPPPAERRGMSCPKCGHNVAESWRSTLKACQSCGAELEIESEAPWFVIVGMLALFLLLTSIFVVLLAISEAISGGIVLVVAGGVILFVFWIWLLIKLTHRWGRLKVRS
jgi:amino acid transporter